MPATFPTSRFRLFPLAIVIVAVGAVIIALLGPGASHAATFTVTNTNDAGAGSFRQAIIDANSAGPGNTIDFSIAGAGPHTIAIASNLPAVAQDGTIIDGTTEPDYVDEPVIVIDGNATGGNAGLDINGSDSVVRGLHLTGFFSNGIDAAGSGTLIELNLLTDNGPGGRGAISLDGQDHVVKNNTITDNRGDATASFSITTGILMEGNTVSDNDRGGIEFGGGEHTIIDNVVTNNGHAGMEIGSSGFSGTRIEGNTVTGNGLAGIEVLGHDGLIIDNLVSGNGEEGIDGFTSAGLDGLEMRDNTITNNGTEGVHLAGAGVTIAGNTISGNGAAGNHTDAALRVRLFDSIVTDNTITNNHQDGLALMTSSTTSEISGNDISNNISDGVHVFAAGGSVIRNNDITANGANGIVVDADIEDLLIGGPEPAASLPSGVAPTSGANNISHNGLAGIFLTPAEPVFDGDDRAVLGDFFLPPVGVTISMNSIIGNGGLGIDLAPEGVAENDEGDPDVGPNNNQNFPTLAAASAPAAATSGGSGVTASLNSLPSTDFRIELFFNASCDDSGHGEGRSFLSSTDVLTTAEGEASAFISTASVPSGDFVTATATNLSTGDTSEFSECLEVTSSATPTPIGTPTTAPSSTPPSGQSVTWGDNNCKDGVNPVDSLFVLRGDAGLPTDTGDCPNMGQDIDVLNASPHVWGDIDCKDGMNPVDSLKILRFDAGLGVSQELDCPAIGSDVVIVG